MIFSFETASPLRKRKVKKDFSLYKRFSEEFKNFENFGASLEEVVYCDFHHVK